MDTDPPPVSGCDSPSLLQEPAHPETLRELARAGLLSDKALRQAMHLALACPDGSAWRRFLDRLLLLLGTALVVAGVLFFFAYNWDDLGRFGKLGLLFAAILGAAVATWRLGTERLAGQAALTAAAVLVGGLLAVYGQAYQTGADAYELFLGWTLLILPWVWLACFPPLWLVFLVLADTALVLYWTQVISAPDSALLFLLLFALNGSAWYLWERFRRRGVAWMAVGWMSRILAVVGLGCLTIPASEAVLGSGIDPWETLSAVLLALLVVHTLRFYRRTEPDLFMLAMALAATVVVVTLFLGRLLFEEADLQEAGCLFLAVILITEVAAVATWLRRIAAEREGSPP